MPEVTEMQPKTSVRPAELSKEDVLHDFWICCVSRECSVLARKEVLTGKAKFGIVGDGKEVPQVAMARAFRKGDWRSGYYRDQTFVFALGLATVETYFAQLYADAENDPWSGGRQMNSHPATATVDEAGEWLNHKNLFNISSDISSTGGQMARALGIALASKKYRESKALAQSTRFSYAGNEISFVTIGDASTSEGIFWETVNAAGVQRVPLLISVWDDGYGISVPKKYQTTKGSISEVLEGFRVNEKGEGLDIYKEKGWDYPALVRLYRKAAQKTRETHIPALIHVEEVTQQLGHSTSGSHERYKTQERLAWERDFDCIVRMGNWMVAQGYATCAELEDMLLRAKKFVKEGRDRAWEQAGQPVRAEEQALEKIFAQIAGELNEIPSFSALQSELKSLVDPAYSEAVKIARRLFFLVHKEKTAGVEALSAFLERSKNLAQRRYHTNLYSHSQYSALKVPVIPPVLSAKSPVKNGFEILNAFWDKVLAKNNKVVIFGEDVGKIGGVNQTLMGMQEKYGEQRVFDTGIREWSIVGQAIGMAMRGLRPVAEIQYLDYLVYGLEPLTDDLATVRYRTNGIQQAPAIISTRGHRLEGIWHSGSPMGMILNSLRGMYVLTPRNFVQAAGLYNTMLQSDDPALLIECLNAYRLKERLPDNIGEYTVPLGVPEVLQEGTDVTLVTYGACVRIALDGIELLKKHGISVELIDVQTLLPFDLEHGILHSLKKTNRVVFMDEDVPGGGTAFMMQEVLEKQGGYRHLDSPPVTLTAKQHRPPYGTDGDYFSKPNAEDVCEVIYDMLAEAEPGRFL